MMRNCANLTAKAKLLCFSRAVHHTKLPWTGGCPPCCGNVQFPGYLPEKSRKQHVEQLQLLFLCRLSFKNQLSIKILKS